MKTVFSFVTQTTNVETKETALFRGKTHLLLKRSVPSITQKPGNASEFFPEESPLLSLSFSERTDNDQHCMVARQPLPGTYYVPGMYPEF